MNVRLALVAPSSVTLAGFRAEHAAAAEDRLIHIAVCRWRRQQLACGMCYRVAERLDQAEARLRRAEQRLAPTEE